MNTVRRMERLTGRVLPPVAKWVLRRAYNRWRSFRADREFGPADVDGTPSADAPGHIIVIVVDALRYDYLSDRTAPFLSGKKPLNAVAPSTWTFPSVSSILTGRHPHEHGGMRKSDDPDAATADEIRIPTLRDPERTLPEVLAGAGFDTYGGFAFAVPFLALRSRFRAHRLYRQADADKVLVDHRSWLNGRGDGRTFSYIHLADLHTPHHPPDPYAREFDVDLTIDDIRKWDYADVTDPSPAAERYQEHKRRLYRSSLRYVDDQLAEYYEALQAEFGSDLLVVLTSDHGEGFWEHAAFDEQHFYDSRPAYCVGHGGTPYECLTRIPLWIDGIDTKTEELSSLVDIAPTILEVLGLSGELKVTGTPLAQPNDSDKLVLTEGTRYGYEKKAIYRNGWKVIKSRGDETTVECRIEDEPAETSIPSDVLVEMLDDFPPWPDSQDDANRVSGIVEQRLRNLGYQ